ncbi:MAG: DUF1906 domain-containing protein [Firmicutes bacterium]|nr:DUF1906 domain-containing protein [Bacillota bacterium]
MRRPCHLEGGTRRSDGSIQWITLSARADVTNAWAMACVTLRTRSCLDLDVLACALPAPHGSPKAHYWVLLKQDHRLSDPPLPLVPLRHPPQGWVHHRTLVRRRLPEELRILIAGPSLRPQAGPILFEGRWRVPSADTACFNGLDNDRDLSAVAPCLARQGYRFAGRYLGGPCYQGTLLTAQEAARLSQAGLYIVSLYSGANAVEAFRCGTQSSAGGRRDGLDAVNRAEALGQPISSAIFLDLQGDQVSSPSAWLSYVETWCEAIRQHQYQPGVYSSPQQLSIIEGEPWGGSRLLYWVAKEYASAALTSPPCPNTVLPFAALWQYALCVNICGSPDADVDSAASLAGMWTLSPSNASAIRARSVAAPDAKAARPG